MIKYILNCKNNHEFESWFSNSEEFEKLKKKNLLEYVGKNFSEEVRDIYYDKSSKKTIYGTTTLKEREELAEEGIELLSVPWVDKEN